MVSVFNEARHQYDVWGSGGIAKCTRLISLSKGCVKVISIPCVLHVPSISFTSDFLILIVFVKKYKSGMCQQAVAYSLLLQPSFLATLVRPVLKVSDKSRRIHNNRQNCSESRTLKRGSRDSSVGVVTRLRPELHGVRFPVESMDYLFSKMSSPAVFNDFVLVVKQPVCLALHRSM
jgi:hypothetical protein